MKRLLYILLFVCIGWTLQAQTASESTLTPRATVEANIQKCISLAKANKYHDAFQVLHAADYAVLQEEKATQKSAPELRYLVAKQRLDLYMRLRKSEDGKIALEKVESIAAQCSGADIKEDLLLTQAAFYQRFNQPEKSEACYRTLVQMRQQGKTSDEEVGQLYEQMISQAKSDKNIAMERVINHLYANWKDSISAVLAARELNELQAQYTESQELLQEKEDKIGTQKGIIGFLIVLAAALAGGLLFFIGVMMRNLRQISKLKSSLALANKNNELKSGFVRNIGDQITPSLHAIETGRNAKEHIAGLKTMLQHTKQYMTLEQSREEMYELKPVALATLGEEVVAKFGEVSKIPVQTDIPRMEFTTNKEAVEELLLVMMGEMAAHEGTERIQLEFKKRGPHSGHFIVTATGMNLPAEKRDHLFKPFAEVQDLTQSDGLSLPTCSLMAYKLHGLLRLDPECRNGARFVLELKS